MAAPRAAREYVDVSDLKRMQRSIQATNRRLKSIASPDLYAEAQVFARTAKATIVAKTPKGATGELRRSTWVRVARVGTSTVEIFMGQSAETASGESLVELLTKGTGIYGPRHAVIKAKGAAFPIPVAGGMIFRRTIQGIKPNPYWHEAMTKVQAERVAFMHRFMHDELMELVQVAKGAMHGPFRPGRL